ncbi:MAG: saccharopine dehydrogenase [Bacteroidetes bacterium]|nr:saccharopine dehydrogenase [Bacteroidota bacterium]
MNILILGAGLVGGPMAIDLAKEKSMKVTVADISREALKKFEKIKSIKTIQQDLSDAGKLKSLLKQADLVVNAVPGFMGFKTLKSIIEAGKNVVDIAFFPEDPFELDNLAKKKGVIAICDMGVAPGMSHVLSSYAYHQLDETTDIRIYVGGLPKVRTWPFEYKAVFSPVDVIEEYTRPARYVVNGELVVKPALTDPELLDLPGVGTLEAFNSDGLRSLIKTLKAKNMIEKTLRYKGHIEKVMVLRDSGFLSTDPITVGKSKISPFEFTTSLLFKSWKLSEGEEDITVMRIEVEGFKKKKKIKFIFDLLDAYDPVTKTHSMARTTGYAATAAVRMIAKGLFSRKGLSVPEYIGEQKECVRFLLEDMKKRGVCYNEE